MTTRVRRTLEEIQAFAVGHHVRIEALRIFNERVASPKEVAAEIGVSLNKAGHHVKILREDGCIELVREEPRGGSVEHFYRAVKRPEISDEEWEELPDDKRRSIIAAIIRNLIAEILSALSSGKMTTDRYLHFKWKSVNVDAQGREEIADEQRESFERQQRIEAESAQRMVESGERGVSVVVATLGFIRRRNVKPGNYATGEP